MNISVERRDAGSSTAQPNIIYKYTLMERSTDHWRITTRSVSIYQQRITLLRKKRLNVRVNMTQIYYSFISFYLKLLRMRAYIKFEGSIESVLLPEPF